jgi:hypothetical protein
MKKNLTVSFLNKETNLQKRDFLSLFLMSRDHLSRIFMLLLLTFSLGGFAQNVKIEKAETYFQSAQLNNANRSNNVSYVKSLVKDLHSSIYLDRGRVNTYGEIPKCLFTDIESISMLKNSRMNLNSIEIITINIKSIEELRSTINLDDFSSISTLKVIHLNVHFDCTTEMLNPMIRGEKSNYLVLYSVEKPS